MDGDVEPNPGPGKRNNPQEKEPNTGSPDEPQRKETLPVQAEDLENACVSRDSAVAKAGPLPPSKLQYQRSLSAPANNVVSFQAFLTGSLPQNAEGAAGFSLFSKGSSAEQVIELQECKRELQRKEQIEKMLENQIQERDREIDTLRSIVASLEQLLYTQKEETTIESKVTGSWKTFRERLSTTLKTLGLVEAAADADDSTPLGLFKELHKTVHCYLGPNYDTCPAGREEEYKHSLRELMELWNKKIGDSSQVPCIMNQLFFYLIANQLYRIGGECKVCPLCFCKKQDRRNSESEGDPDSHIFPQSLLKTYSKVHSEGAGDFIWDMSLSDKFGARKLTVKLLCQACESSTSHAEHKLRDLYIHVLAKSGKRIAVKGDWLLFILASIMFRGLVYSVSLMKELHNGQFELFKALVILQKYCNKPQIAELPTLYLDLLPSGPFNPELTDIAYIFDLQLRNPQFTQVVEMEEGTFLYTKFDCFHCSLPLINNNLGFENALHSGKTVIFHSEKERKHVFPRVLLKRNQDKAVHLAEYVMSQLQNPRLVWQCKVFIQRQPGIHCQDFETVQWPGTKGVPPQEDTDAIPHEFKEITDDKQIEVLIKEAAQASPLKAVRISLDMYKHIISEKNRRISDLQSKLDKTRKDLKEERRRKTKELKPDTNAAERQMRAIEVEKENLQEKYDRLQQEYDNLQAMLQTKNAELQVRVQELTQENQELRNLVQPIQEGQEAEDSSGQEQLLSLTTEAVLDDSQGLPGEMV